MTQISSHLSADDGAEVASGDEVRRLLRDPQALSQLPLQPQGSLLPFVLMWQPVQNTTPLTSPGLGPCCLPHPRAFPSPVRVSVLQAPLGLSRCLKTKVFWPLLPLGLCSLHCLFLSRKSGEHPGTLDVLVNKSKSPPSWSQSSKREREATDQQ